MQRSVRGAALAIILLLLQAVPVLSGPRLTQEDGERMLEEVVQVLESFGLTYDRKMPLYYRPHDEVVMKAHEVFGTARELNSFYQPYNPECIWLSSDLPRGEALPTLCHWLGDAWLTRNTPVGQSLEMQAGFLIWLTHKFLKSMGDYRRVALLERRTPSEGTTCFRKLLAYERERGTKAVLDLMRAQKEMPRESRWTLNWILHPRKR